MWTLPLQWPDPVADSRQVKRSRNLDTIFMKSSSTCRAKFDFRCHRIFFFFFNLSLPLIVHCSSSPWGARITCRYFGSEGVTWVRPHEIHPCIWHTGFKPNGKGEQSKAHGRHVALCLLRTRATARGAFVRVPPTFLHLPWRRTGRHSEWLDGWNAGGEVSPKFLSFAPLPGLPLSSSGNSSKRGWGLWGDGPPVLTDLASSSDYTQ